MPDNAPHTRGPLEARATRGEQRGHRRRPPGDGSVTREHGGADGAEDPQGLDEHDRWSAQGQRRRASSTVHTGAVDPATGMPSL